MIGQSETEAGAEGPVPVSRIASTLESLFGGRQVTEFKRDSRQYDVIVQIEDDHSLLDVNEVKW